MNKKLRVLIIDDSADDTILLVRGLSHGGFEPEFERVETPEAMRAALHQTWDIIISDYAMPHFSGLGALSVLKETGLDLPFILVSGTIGENLAVQAVALELEGIIAKRKGSIYDPAAEWGLAQVQDQSIPGVRDRRIHAGQSLRCADRWFL